MLIRSHGDRAFHKFYGPDLVISLNGEPVEHVIEADDEAGYLIRYVRGGDGKLVEDGPRYRTERAEGTVVFSGSKRYSPDDAKRDAAAKRARRQARNLTIANRDEVRKAGEA
jgi:hypothetical protein